MTAKVHKKVGYVGDNGSAYPTTQLPQPYLIDKIKLQLRGGVFLRYIT